MPCSTDLPSEWATDAAIRAALEVTDVATLQSVLTPRALKRIAESGSSKAVVCALEAAARLPEAARQDALIRLSRPRALRAVASDPDASRIVLAAKLWQRAASDRSVHRGLQALMTPQALHTVAHDPRPWVVVEAASMLADVGRQDALSQVLNPHTLARVAQSGFAPEIGAAADLVWLLPSSEQACAMSTLLSTRALRVVSGSPDALAIVRVAQGVARLPLAEREDAMGQVLTRDACRTLVEQGDLGLTGQAVELARDGSYQQVLAQTRAGRAPRQGGRGPAGPDL